MLRVVFDALWVIEVTFPFLLSHHSIFSPKPEQYSVIITIQAKCFQFFLFFFFMYFLFVAHHPDLVSTLATKKKTKAC